MWFYDVWRFQNECGSAYCDECLPTTKCMLNGDPSWSIAVAPVLAWIAETWRASTGSRAPHMSLADMHRMWHAAVPCDTNSWSTSKGPLGNCALSLRRLQWEWPEPFRFVDDLGNADPIPALSPAMWAKRLHDAVQRYHERRHATKLAGNEAAFAERRAYVGVAARMTSQHARTLDALGKAVVRMAACDCLWSFARADACGYDVDPICALCRAAPDTPHHRFYMCTHPSAISARRQVAPEWFIREASQSSPNDPLFTRLAIPHPADVWPAPDEGEYVAVSDGDGNILGAHDLSVSGTIFTDGSCVPHYVPELSRAAWSIVQVSREATVMKVIQGTVPKSLPQSPQAAEYAPYAAVAQFAISPCELFIDCQSVVSSAQQTPREQLCASRMYAGVMRWAGSRRGAQFLTQVNKTKAHRTFDVTRLEEFEHWTAWANDQADSTAKDAVARHPQPSTETRDKVNADILALKRVALIMSATWRLWPRLPVRMTKRPKPELEAAIPLARTTTHS